ncbi:MAG TPA: hypothetical protein PK505_03115 [Treponemataceae bacterium]|nr:hypothetical protein [Treponemataceae bacterium]HQC26268.1 hypothetical protein [Treponemataceae bacterium]
MKDYTNKITLYLIFSFTFMILACKSTDTDQSFHDSNIAEKEETIILESSPLLEEIIVEEEIKPIEKKTEIDEEYFRSTSALKDELITQDAFLADKKEILEKIDALAQIMLARDYGKWLYYLSPSSKEYWQNQKNLADVSSRLPVKGYTLKNLDDYFRMIFIPSRQNSKVDEIRYISPTLVKAVEVRGNQDIVYYVFVKINNTWLLELDTL